MDKLIQYFNDNLILLYVTATVLLVCTMVIVLVIVLRKKRLAKALRAEEVKTAAEALLNLQQTEAQNSAYPISEPVLEKTTDIKPKTDNVKDPEEENEIINLEAENTPKIVEKSAYKPENKDISKSQEIKSDNGKAGKPTVNEAPKQEETAVTTERLPENETENITTETAKFNSDGAKKSEDIIKPNDNVIKQNKEKFRPTRATSPAQTNKPEAEKPVVKYAGKWLIYVEDGKYAANLVASNGEVLLRSESYTALSGVKSGIETIKNNVAKNNFAISLDKNGNFFFKLYSSSTRLLCVSEGYSTKAVCESAVESVKRFAKTAVIEIKKDEN